ncbi:MAG: hypothetical protein FWD56_08380, partial [Bacteroidales bacterium]|nr:hypothetical protein [Bacteroidales bacterium]
GLMKPPVDFGIQSYNATLFNPTFPLPTNNQFSSFDNKIMGAQRATQSIQINLQSGLKPNKAAITAGFMVNAFCLGGLIYQMAQPPKPNPNQPKGAPSR